MSDSLPPRESQHARPPCPSPTPGVHSDSRPSSSWCHPAISSSVIPFSSCPQSLPASESFPMSQLFAWGGQSTGVSASALFLPKKSQGWSPWEWTGWISLQSKGTQESSPAPQFKSISSSSLSFLYSPTLTSIHDYWKNYSCLKSKHNPNRSKDKEHLLEKVWNLRHQIVLQKWIQNFITKYLHSRKLRIFLTKIFAKYFKFVLPFPVWKYWGVNPMGFLAWWQKAENEHQLLELYLSYFNLS